MALQQVQVASILRWVVIVAKDASNVGVIPPLSFLTCIF